MKNCQKLFRTEIKLTRLILCSASHPRKFPGTANLSWFRLQQQPQKWGTLKSCNMSYCTYQNIIMCSFIISQSKSLNLKCFSSNVWCAVIVKLQGFYALLFYNSNFLLNPTTATMIIVALPLMKNHRANLGNIQCSNSSSTLWSYLWQLSSSAAMIMIGQEMSFKSRIDLMINTSSARLLSDQSHLSMVMIKIVHFLWIGVFLSL